MKVALRTVPLAIALITALPIRAQMKPVAMIPEPPTPAARPFHDSRSGVSFQVPAGWDLNRKDRQVSTFNLDARSTIKSTQLRAVANITFNPFPLSTFSGAYFYVSFTPRLSATACARQASVKNAK